MSGINWPDPQPEVTHDLPPLQRIEYPDDAEIPRTADVWEREALWILIRHDDESIAVVDAPLTGLLQ